MAVLEDADHCLLHNVEHIVEQGVIHLAAIDNAAPILREEEFFRMLRCRICFIKFCLDQCFKIHEKPSLNTITNGSIITYFFLVVLFFYRFFKRVSRNQQPARQFVQSVGTQCEAQILKRRDEWSKREAQFEAREGVRIRAEDGDAIHLVTAFLGGGEPIVYGEAPTIARRTCDFLDLRIDAAAGVGDVVHIIAEFVRQEVMRVRDFVAQFVRRCELSEICMRHRVALESDEPGLFHLVDLIPCQVVRVGVREIIDEKDGRLEPILFQNGVGILVVVRIAIVKGDDDGLVGQRCPIFESVHHLVNRDGGVALVCKIRHLRLELVRPECERVAVLLLDLMIVENRHTRGGAHENTADEEEQERDGEQGKEQPLAEAFHIHYLLH